MWHHPSRLKQKVEDFKARTHNLPPEMAKQQFEEESLAEWDRIEKCVLSFRAGENILSGGRFDTLSLGTWLSIAHAVDLTYVPAQLAVLLSGTEVIHSMFAPVELNLTEEQLRYRSMVRLDNCGCESLKQKMSYRGDHSPSGIEGAVEKDGKYYFVFDDRTSRGILEYVGQIGPGGDIKHPVWWRPWVRSIPVEVPRPKFMGRSDPDVWPLEWRVIVQKGAISAISAYYPQAPVTLTDEIGDHIHSVLAQTVKLLTFMQEKAIQPWHPLYIDWLPEDEISFSCDFISTPSGPAFLEAGPAVPVGPDNVPVIEWGAHPCNLMDKPIAGVALSRDIVLPLADFVG